MVVDGHPGGSLRRAAGSLLIVVLVVTFLAAAGSSTAAATDSSTAAAADSSTAAAAGSSTAAAAADPGPATIRAMVANVGNVSPHCAEQAFSLCLLPVEERVAAGMAAIDPDVVALIEVLPPDLCDGLTPQNPFNSCAIGQDPPQALRLLAHDDYDVVCGDRFAWDCLAVRASIGSIDGCDGGYCGPIAPARPVVEGCDPGFQSFFADVELRGVPLRIGVTHPNSSDVDCRAAEVADLFDAAGSDREVLVLGDFNLDPYRGSDASVDVWDDHVGEGRPFQLLSGIVEHDPPYFTLLPFESAQLDPTGSSPINLELGDLAGASTIDHAIATAGLGGVCTTLGEAPGTERIEGADGGLDHRALDCEVVLGATAAVPAEPAPVEGPAPVGDPPTASDPAPGAPTSGADRTGPTLPVTGGPVLAGLLPLAALLAASHLRASTRPARSRRRCAREGAGPYG